MTPRTVAEGWGEYNGWRQLMGLRPASLQEYLRVATAAPLTSDERDIYDAYLDAVCAADDGDDTGDDVE